MIDMKFQVLFSLENNFKKKKKKKKNVVCYNSA